MNSFRFGIEWSRLEPEEGMWDDAAINHYREYIISLKRRGIEPVPTLWHWTMPLWFVAKGGFEKKRNVAYFERFAAKVASEFGQELNYVLTLNEPNVYASLSYLAGWWPPQRKNPLLALKVYLNLKRAHCGAYRVIKAKHPSIKVSLAYHLADIRPLRGRNLFNRLTVKVISYFWNWWYLDRITQFNDFVGVNFYFREYRDFLGRIKNPNKPLSDLGWYMEPEGLTSVLTSVWRRYKKPILITENGLADSADAYRKWWIDESMKAMQVALNKGVNLIGYLHWSLLDNFEWSYGWWPKFGLVAVDRSKNMKRIIRPSALWFAEQIKTLRK